MQENRVRRGDMLYADRTCGGPRVLKAARKGRAIGNAARWFAADHGGGSARTKAEATEQQTRHEVAAALRRMTSSAHRVSPW